MEELPILSKVNAPMPPVMPWAVFADWVGLRPDIVRGMLDRGHLPEVKIGKYRMINLALLQQQLIEVSE